ncbi:casein kinase 2 regulatory subunit [Rhizina undulata]
MSLSPLENIVHQQHQPDCLGSRSSQQSEDSLSTKPPPPPIDHPETTQAINNTSDLQHVQPLEDLEADEVESNEDESAFNLAALKAAAAYRRSGSWGGSRVFAGTVKQPLVHKDIGIVRREQTRSFKKDFGTLSEPASAAPASASGVGGRPSGDELADSTVQQSPTSPHFQATPPPAPGLSTHPLEQSPSASEAEEEEEEEQSEEEEEDEIDMEEEESWIQSYCNIVGHEYFAEVSEDFIEDDFNLTGLGAMVPMYKEALEMILDVEPEDDSDSPASASESLSEQPAGAQSGYRRRSSHMRISSDLSVIESSAELLYGLIHQRFITSRQGIQIMYEKYLSNHFGTCPRVNCNSARVIPCGYSDTPGVETVKLFCPSCCDIYVPPNSRFQTVDGAFFGTTFPSLFLMTFPELEVAGKGRREPESGSNFNSAGGRKGSNAANAPMVNGVQVNNLAPGLGKGKRYEMKIYGFRVSERARSGPRMAWLRSKPDDFNLLDETTRFAQTQAAGYSSEEDGVLEEDESEEEESEGEDTMAIGGDGSSVRSHTRGAARAGTSPMNTNGGR